MSWSLFLLIFAVGSVVRGLSRGTTRPSFGPPPVPPHCPGCHLGHPSFANYCRRCGRRL
jgi:hypothetical protein